MDGGCYLSEPASADLAQVLDAAAGEEAVAAVHPLADLLRPVGPNPFRSINPRHHADRHQPDPTATLKPFETPPQIERMSNGSTKSSPMAEMRTIALSCSRKRKTSRANSFIRLRFLTGLRPWPHRRRVRAYDPRWGHAPPPSPTKNHSPVQLMSSAISILQQH